MKIALLQSYFKHSLESRREEFLLCLNKNIQNTYIKQIILSCDGSVGEDDLPKSSKIVRIPRQGRCTYDELFYYCNEFLPGWICMIANTDIWYDDTLKCLSLIDWNNKIVSLTRYEKTKFGNKILHDFEGCSHDTWIFRSGLKDFDNSIIMGILGCDSMLHINALKAGIDLECPSLDIKSYHEHSDLDHNSKTRNNRVNGLCYWDHPDWYDYRLYPTHINEKKKDNARMQNQKAFIHTHS